MSLIGLVLRNIAGNPFRSIVVLLCALVVSGFSLSTALIIRGADSSLSQANQRLGADILLVPKGSATTYKSALTMGKPAAAWMPAATLAQVAQISGVQVVSPQLYVGTLIDSPNCVSSELFVIAIDPQSDFSVAAWLPRPLPQPIARGQAIGGTFVTADESGMVSTFDVPLKLLANLEPTGTSLDQTIFVTFETAQDIIGRPRDPKKVAAPATNSISSALVRVQHGFAVPNVAMQIEQAVPDLTAIDSPSLLQSQRRQIAGLANTVFAALAIGLALSVAAVYLIFAMAVNERRWQIGVLRALGATQASVFLSLMVEANLLGLGGGLVGLLLSSFLVYGTKDDLITALQIPFLLPSTLDLAFYFVVALFGIAAGVTLSAFFPARSTSRLEPSLAMRE